MARATVIGPTLEEEGVPLTITVRLARGAKALSRWRVAMLHAGSPGEGSRTPPSLLGSGTTNGTGALTVSLASAEPLLDVKGCQVRLWDPSAYAGPAGAVGVVGSPDTSIMLYLTSTPSEPAPIDPETMRPPPVWVDCEVR
jgi:hypothetical protein